MTLRKTNMLFILFLVFFFAQSKVRAQEHVIDSLMEVLNTKIADTTRIEVNNILGEQFLETHPQKAEAFWKKSSEIAIRSLKIKSGVEKRTLQILYSRTLNNLGVLYDVQGKVQTALDFYAQSLKLKELCADHKGEATLLMNIGYVYFSQGDKERALENYKRSLEIHESIKNKKGIASACYNIAYYYRSIKDTSRAMSYYKRSLDVYTSLNNQKGIASVYNNMAQVMSDNGNESIALKLFELALMKFKEINYNNGISLAMINLARIHFNNGRQGIAESYLKQSLEISKRMNSIDNIEKVSNALYLLYKKQSKYKVALDFYELKVKMRDSLNNESTRKASIKSQLKYEYEKQAAADSVAHAKESEIKNAELAKQKAEISAKKNQQYALFGGLFCVCVFGVFMYNRFKVTQKQKGIIEEQKELVESQKHLVEEKQKEILDSIHYARRIQMAQIPSEKRVKGMLSKLKKS